MRATIDVQRQFYDARWSGVRYANGLKLSRAVAILGALSETGLLEPRILELGCGTGWLSAILGQFGPTTGVELSGEAVDAARGRYPFLDLSQVDLAVWTPPEAEFDVVVSHEVIEHLTDQARHLAIARRALRPGGFLILTTPNADTVRSMAPAPPDHPTENALSDQLIENILTRDELLALVRSAEFRVVRHTSLILGAGGGALRRVAGSTKVRAALAPLHLAAAFDRWALSAGAGLHTLVVAQRT